MGKRNGDGGRRFVFCQPAVNLSTLAPGLQEPDRVSHP